MVQLFQTFQVLLNQRLTPLVLLIHCLTEASITLADGEKCLWAAGRHVVNFNTRHHTECRLHQVSESLACRCCPADSLIEFPPDPVASHQPPTGLIWTPVFVPECNWLSSSATQHRGEGGACEEAKGRRRVRLRTMCLW